MKHRTARPKRSRGQALTEYALIAFFAAGALFVPILPSAQGGGNTSVFLLFVEVFDIYINSFHLVVSMPVP